MKKKIMLIILLVVLVLAIIGTSIFLFSNFVVKNGKIDDWKFSNKNAEEDGGIFGIFNTAIDSVKGGATMSFEASDNIGFAVGGAKDANNFRKNIKEGYFPISTDITYNGLFYDYYFNTGSKNNKEDLFSPSYVTTISKDPISGNEEYYMTVGLNSNIKESDFSRKKLNLVVVLDISGSMSSSFNSYYYDDPLKEESEDYTKSKMQIANESVNILIDNLNDEDRFGMVLFDNTAYLGKPISEVRDTDMEKIKKHILEIESHGGTNFESGYVKATELFEKYKNAQKDEYENRIIVITDAMPNRGETSKEGLFGYIDENSKNGIYTTFIGVGVDFNTEVIEAITDVKGANYYSVHSSDEFKSRMGEEFEYMVTPLVFDLKLDFISDDFEIEKVYGTDTANKESGNIMYVNTLFPSKSSEGQTKGGVILLKLKSKTGNNDGDIKLSVSYKDRSGKNYSNSETVNFSKSQDEENSKGINKAILLTRYVNTIKNWILYERTEEERFLIIKNTGIIDCDFMPEDILIILGENERKSVKLSVSDEYKKIFSDLKSYINTENESIKDDTLKQEVEILDLLINNK